MVHVGRAGHSKVTFWHRYTSTCILDDCSCSNINVVEVLAYRLPLARRTYHLEGFTGISPAAPFACEQVNVGRALIGLICPDHRSVACIGGRGPEVPNFVIIMHQRLAAGFSRSQGEPSAGAPVALCTVVAGARTRCHIVKQLEVKCQLDGECAVVLEEDVACRTSEGVCRPGGTGANSGRSLHGQGRQCNTLKAA